jgi:hypothetical protein
LAKIGGFGIQTRIRDPIFTQAAGMEMTGLVNLLNDNL